MEIYNLNPYNSSRLINVWLIWKKVEENLRKMEEQHKKWKNTVKNGWTTRKLEEKHKNRLRTLLELETPSMSGSWYQFNGALMCGGW